MGVHKRLNGAVFDFNGTLVLDSPLHEKAWIETSEKLRGRPFTREEMSIHMHGRSSRHVYEYLLNRKVSDDELLELIQFKESKYRQLCIDAKEGFNFLPGAVELLDYLVEHNIPRNIATASEITNVKFFFEYLKLGRWFDFDKVAYDDGKIQGKPHPALFLRAAQRIGESSEECIGFEDAVSGIQALMAGEFGWIIGIQNLELLKHGANEIIKDYNEFNYSLLGD